MQAIQILMGPCILLAAQVELYADIKARAVELDFDSVNAESVREGWVSL